MVALEKSAKISGSGIRKAWAARWPKSPLPTEGQKKDNTLSYQVGESQVIYGVMPAPIPWSDFEGPCENAVFWPNATAEMRKHKRHVIVTVLGDADRIEQMTILTQATIALTDACDGSIGVYWCNSSHVLPPEKFSEIACKSIPNGLPLPIWVNFCITKNADGSTAGFTKGLAAFDLMEFETRKSPETPEELRDRLLGLAEYVLNSDNVIEDGDTIGDDADEKIKVTYAQSSFGGDGDVMRLKYRKRKSSGTKSSRTKSSGYKLTTYGRIHAVATLLCTIGFGYLLYAFFPFLRGSLFRHFLLIPMILVFGFILLGVSDKFLNKTFGWEAFDD